MGKHEWKLPFHCELSFLIEEVFVFHFLLLATHCQRHFSNVNKTQVKNQQSSKAPYF